MIQNSKIIILRSIDYQESSKILTVLSEHHGKIALIARGAKRPKNKLAGTIELGTIIDAVYYYKSSRSVQTISEANTIYRTMNFRTDLERASILYSTLELINQLAHDNDENTELFKFAEDFIPWLGEFEGVNASIFPYVQLRLSNLIGFGLRIEGETKGDQYLNISSGFIGDRPVDELSYKLTATQYNYISTAMDSKSSKIFTMPFDNGELKQLIHHLDVYFKYHVEGFKDRRSDAIFEQMI